MIENPWIHLAAGLWIWWAVLRLCGFWAWAARVDLPSAPLRILGYPHGIRFHEAGMDLAGNEFVVIGDDGKIYSATRKPTGDPK